MNRVNFKQLSRLVFSAAVALLLIHSPVLAATNTVTTLADSGAGSLRQAIPRIRTY